MRRRRTRTTRQAEVLGSKGVRGIARAGATRREGDDDGFADPECFVVDERRAEHAERRHRGREEQAVEGAGDRDAERKRDECFCRPTAVEDEGHHRHVEQRRGDEQSQPMRLPDGGIGPAVGGWRLPR